jgi:L-threonylcarbamoyladenylate synthase
MRILPANEAALEEAVQVLRAGEILAYPTETVYGLGVDPFNPDALEKLYHCKGRAESDPVLMVISEPTQLGALVENISPEAQACIDAFWPGPLSLLFPRENNLPEMLSAGTDWVCVRCPGNDFTRSLCRAFGGAITSTSANLSGKPPAISADTITLPGISLILDGGTLGKQPPSSVFNPITGEILREGAISRKHIKEALGNA